MAAPCRVGIESTIVDCTRGVPVLLRPGTLTREQIEAACGERLRSVQELQLEAPRASGHAGVALRAAGHACG